MQSKAATVKDYLASLPPERREVVEHVRKVVNDNLDKDYREGMQYGMIGWAVPHEVFPDGYHCDPSQPLTFAGLAAQKNAYSLYLMCIYGHEGERAWFESAWKKTGKKLDAGKACIRFKKVEDLALDVIAEAVRRVPAKKYVEHYVKSREAHAAGKAKPAKKTPAKSAGAVKAKKKVVAKKVSKAKGK
jgi:hypothetical protein